MEFDYVIVGGGSAGATLAARLSEDSSKTVCLLEAGGENHKNVNINVPAMLSGAIHNDKTNWQYETTPQPGLGGRRGYQPRGKTLGGSSAINGMLYVRGHRKDYDNWADMGCPGWSYDDVLPYFKKSENYVEGGDEHHGGGGELHVNNTSYFNDISFDFIKACEAHQIRHNPDFNRGDNSGAGPFQVTHFHSKTETNHGPGRRASTAAAFLQPIRHKRDNLKVITHAHATRVAFDGKRATGVEFQSKHGLKTVSARREVIVSSGAFGSPQLLQLSGVGDANALKAFGIKSVHHNPTVGENLHDHIDLLHGYRVNDKAVFGLTPRGLFNAVKSIGQFRKNGTGFMTTVYSQVGAFFDVDEADGWPDIQIHFLCGLGFDHGRDVFKGHGVGAHVCILRPVSRGSVKLASADPFEAPLIDPNFLGEDADMELLLKGVKKTREIMATAPLKDRIVEELVPGADVTTDEGLRQVIRDRADTVYHPVGSCRMGSDDGAVVDLDLRVKGVENLRFVDASVMPQVISGNTNAPTIMIAEKAADLIKAAAKAA